MKHQKSNKAVVAIVGGKSANMATLIELLKDQDNYDLNTDTKHWYLFNETD